MKLYYNPQSRAAIAKWMLDECGAQYDIVQIDFAKQEHKTPEFLRINPAGKLPALVDGAARVFENTAICLYLGEKYPEANLAPKIGAPERGRYFSLMVYSTSHLEPAMSDFLLKVESLPQRGWSGFETVKDVIESELGDGPYLFGDWFTAADGSRCGVTTRSARSCSLCRSSSRALPSDENRQMRIMEINDPKKRRNPWRIKNARTASANAALNKARGYLKEVKFIAATIVPMLARARKSAPVATQVADKEFIVRQSRLDSISKTKD